MDFVPAAETEHVAVIQGVKLAQFRRTPKGGVWDFHRADARKYVIFLDGQVEIGIGDGLSHGGSITQPDQSILDAARSSASSG